MDATAGLKSPGVRCSECGGFIKTFRLKGVRWFECLGCERVIVP